MAVNATPPLPKSQPDIARLNGFSGHTITVTKHLQPRNSVGQSVVPTQPMPLPQILDLMTKLPLAHGPGFYFFTCSDTGGNGDDTWMVRLGPPDQEVQMPFGALPGPGSPVEAPPPGAINIGNGFFYNEAMGVLTAPWRKMYNWRPGEALPEPPPTPLSGGPASFLPPGMPGVPGWGTFPANDDSRQIKEMEARLAAEQRQREREEDNRRREQEREDRRREVEEQRRRDDARDAQMSKLFETLLVKPTGPSDTELRIQRELEETKRRVEEQQREDTRRREEQSREDRYRADMQAQRERTEALMREIREKDNNRPDPLLALMTTVMTSTQQQASQSVQAVRDAATISAQSADRHTQQLVEAMRSDKTGAAEATRMTLETTSRMMDMQSQMFQQAMELQNSGGAPWYASAIQGALEKIGPIANAVAARAQAQQPPQMPAPRQPPAARPMAPGTTRPIPAVASPMTGLPPSVHTGERPEGVQYDATTETFIVPGGVGHPGYRVPSAYVGQHGWTETLKKLAQESAPSPVAAFMPPAVAAPTLTIVPPSGPAAGAMNGAVPTPASKRGRGRKPAPPPPPVNPAIPPPADARGYSRDEMQAFDHDTMLAIVSPFDDATLFGEDIWPYVQQLRGDPPDPAKAAEFILQGKAQLAAAGKSAPAMDLLEAAQLDVFVERLFPDGGDDYQEAVAKALAAAMGLNVLEEAES